MTIRAVLIGFTGAAILNALCYFNDFVLRQSYLVGSYLPLTVYGGLLIVVLGINPVICKVLGQKFGLKGSELAVIMALLLTACYVPGRGLMHYFTTLQAYPHYYQKTRPGWQAEKIVEQAPKRMLMDAEGENEEAFDKFLQGYQNDERSMSLSDIPWGAWKGSLSFWTPLIICFSIGLIGLALAVHRQWSKHEHLAYPIASFASSIMSDEEGKIAPVFKRRSFWIGAGVVLIIHMSNYLTAWFPEHMVGIPVRHNFTSIAELFPLLKKGGGYWLFYPTIYFCVVGFAYFLASDVSLSLGIAPFLYCTAVGVMMGMGMEVRSGGFLYPSNESFFYAGSYFAIFAMIIYAGRHYYLGMFKKAVWVDKLVTDEERAAVWGLRTYMAAAIFFILQLVIVGLDWQLAVLYTMIATVTFVVISRIVAETGAFFIHAWFFPCAFIWGVMGERALGIQPMLIMMMVSSLLLIDPREALMPFVAHALKISDDKHVALGRVAAASGIALIIAFAVAIPATLYWQYNKGALAMGDGWTNRAVPTFSFNNAVKVSTKLKAQGVYEEAQSTSGFARFLKIRPKNSCLVSFAIFFALTLGCSIARLRLAWWPIHPVLFAVLGTFQSKMLAVSFLLGWGIKVMVNKFGGARTYRDLKPLMMGLIAGEIFGGVIPLIVGGIYYLIQGEAPSISFQIFRG